MNYFMASPIHQSLKKLHSGQISRRSFLQQMARLGLASSTVDLLLTSCSQAPEATHTTSSASIEWWSNGTGGAAGNDSFQKLVNKYMQINKSVTITRNSVSFNNVKAAFEKNSKTQKPDIISVDIVWLLEFIANHWIQPLSKGLFTPTDYLDLPMSLVNFHNELYAAPLHTDIGLLFRLTDLVPDPPQSFLEMQSKAEDVQLHEKIKWGYCWQAAYVPKDNANPQGEALMSNIVELLNDFGTDIFKNPKLPRADEITITSPQAHNALSTMIGWINTISPDKVLDSNEDEAAIDWLSGTTAFARSWPYLISDSNNTSNSKTTPIYGRYDISRPGKKSCLGGWQLAINANTTTNRKACEDFISWMLQDEAQEYLAVNEGFFVTLKRINESPYLKEWNPFAPKLGEIYSDNASIALRPVSAKYSLLADIVENEIHTALLHFKDNSSNRDRDITQALANIENKLITLLEE